ncbi:MAG: hypothetical protein C4B57_03900 [Deltaproteobacteria bacterium]|nr:MAG: hypothetical protein C4B57_03900 [Deltaproteobacteria bacterium]
MKPKSASLEKIIAKGGDYLRRENLFKVKAFLDNLGIVKFIRRFNASEDSDTEIPKEVVSYIQEKTIDDIKDLSRLIGRDVSAWIY